MDPKVYAREASRQSGLGDRLAWDAFSFRPSDWDDGGTVTIHARLPGYTPVAPPLAAMLGRVDVHAAAEATRRTMYLTATAPVYNPPFHAVRDALMNVHRNTVWRY